MKKMMGTPQSMCRHLTVGLPLYPRLGCLLPASLLRQATGPMTELAGAGRP